MRIIRKDPSSLSIYQHISLVETHIHTQLMFSLHLPKTFLGSSSFPHCPHPDQQLLRIPKLFHSPWFRFKAKTPLYTFPFNREILIYRTLILCVVQINDSAMVLFLFLFQDVLNNLFSFVREFRIIDISIFIFAFSINCF